ncbi:MAG: mannose-1-phosphate guanylyltransferase/mannose-6-phosphate isomerase [Gammaproteobacteria bacterium]|nr:MAG: mannose-1-phosphate guanylyltransferase/mannose-6-phosphate isomerase [Gammaproteobacteria bacterium]
MITPVILSGGSGTRLWPLSRKLHPKQLLPLLNQTSLLQDTINRLDGLEGIESTIVICNEEYRFMVAEQVHETSIDSRAIILEPVGRNTAPAIALAAFNALQANEEAVLLVLPADHDIKIVSEFHKAIKTGLQQAREGHFVTFGIVPDAPETGFGYIKAASTVAVNQVADIEKFVEKPDVDTATQYLKEGGYYWNSGMFMFKASDYLNALKEFAPEIYSASDKAMSAANTDMDFIRVDAEEFKKCPADSIDYAVMEKVSNAVVIPVDIGWSDVGSWSALHDIGERDENNNIIIGDAKCFSTTNSYVRAESKLVTTLGIEDIIIVDTDDALLVANKNHVQGIKEIVEALTDENRDEVILHKRVCRPWGSYQGIDHADRFQVKRITVNPGATLSLQLHHHRAEHWVIVSGTAKVTKGEDEFILTENESIYIPLGTKHRLENIGQIPLELIEVQTGSYLGEDDIVRFEDIYGREKT